MGTWRHTILLASLLPVLLLGCTGGEVSPEEPRVTASEPAPVLPDRYALEVPAPRELRTRDGLLVVAWAPVGGAIPVNEHFEVDVTVRRTGANPAADPVAGSQGDLPGPPLEDALVSMTCYMPAHGHGMLREPRTEHLGGGVYRVRGLLLHMGGEWSISITATIDGLASTADDSITL